MCTKCHNIKLKKTSTVSETIRHFCETPEISTGRYTPPSPPQPQAVPSQPHPSSVPMSLNQQLWLPQPQTPRWTHFNCHGKDTPGCPQAPIFSASSPWKRWQQL